jgi:hypothetical protein
MFRNIRCFSLVVICATVFVVNPANLRAQGTAAQAPAAHPAATPAASIWGHVTDNHSSPLGGAKVTLLNEDTKESTGASTDGTGQYRFEGLRPGNYTVSFDASGLIPKKHQLRIKAGTKKVEVNERLKPPPEPETK